jgi:hypothetical protein
MWLLIASTLTIPSDVGAESTCAPVRLINADPSVPHLDDAAFDIGEIEIFLDAGKVEVRLLGKVGEPYDVPADRKR